MRKCVGICVQVQDAPSAVAATSIQAARSDGGLSLIVEDDGIGLPAGAETNALSHGISGMRQRVRALKGEFRIQGRSGAGTTIELHIPLPHAAQAKKTGATSAPA